MQLVGDKLLSKTAKLALVGLSLLAASVTPDPALAQQDEGPSLEEMANKANNPLSDVWLLIVENDTSLLSDVPGTEVLNVTLLEPVIPVPVFEESWNLIFRPIIPIVSAPIGSGGRTSGLGDSVLLTLLGPNRDDGFVWGLGPTWILPTATDNLLGQEKWQVGPAGLAVRLGKEHGGLGIENWNIGVLGQQWFSYAGDGGRAETSQANIQYFINWKMNATQLVGMTPNITVDWKAKSSDKLSFPIGLGTIGMFKLGRLPIRWGAEVQYFIAQRRGGPEWNFKVFFAPIILNPFK